MTDLTSEDFTDILKGLDEIEDLLRDCKDAAAALKTAANELRALLEVKDGKE